MKQFVLSIVLMASLPLFSQDVKHENTNSWKFFAGFIQPVGKWAKDVDFYDENGYGSPVYYSSFAGQTGLHAKFGFTAGIGYCKNYLKKSGGQRRFGMLFYPCIVDVIFYDLRSNGPAITSSTIKPMMQFELGLAPAYTINAGGSSIRAFLRSGAVIKKTSGEVHFERSNYAPPITSSHYTGNDIYIDKSNYSYTGAGVTIGPGIEFSRGRLAMSAELHGEITVGKYIGSAAFKDYYGNYTPYGTSDNVMAILKTDFLAFMVSYKFGG